MSPTLIAELAALLRQPPEASRAALERRLLGLSAVPPVGDLVELGARARHAGASDEELWLAIATLLGLHAPPAGAVRQ